MTLDRIREVYNAKCHPAVMLERFDVHKVTEAFLAASFGNLERTTLHDFLEYYALASSTISSNDRFEVLVMKHWKVSYKYLSNKVISSVHALHLLNHALYFNFFKW